MWSDIRGFVSMVQLLRINTDIRVFLPPIFKYKHSLLRLVHCDKIISEGEIYPIPSLLE